MKRRIVVALAVLVVATGYVFLPKLDAGKKAAPTKTAGERCAAAEGKVEIIPGYEAEVGSELEGRIAEFPVREGDAVKKGQVIAVMENSDIRAKLREAEAELAVSRSKLKEIASGSREEEKKAAAAVLESALADLEYEKASLARFRELYKRGVIAKETLDEKEKNAKNAEARAKKASEDKLLVEKGPKRETIRLQEDMVRRAEASVEYYRRLLEKTVIIAPISGKVIRKYLEAGESSTKERALAAIADTERIRINAEVDETDIGVVRIGYVTEVRSDAFPSAVFRGHVREIADYAGVRKVRPNDQARNMDMKVIGVKVVLAERTPLKPGMTVDVKIMPNNP